MQQDYPRSAWYDQSLTPPMPLAVLPAPLPARNQPRRGGMRTAILVICAVILGVACIYALSDRFQRFLPVVESEIQIYPERPFRGRDGDVPSDPDDFRDFFEEYYADAEEEDRVTGSLLERTPGDPSVTVPIVSTEGLEELSLQELYNRSIVSVVGIKAFYDRDSGYGWGTGIVLTADGYLVTNQHVVDGAVRATVILPDGSEVPALLVGEDTQTDIAVLKVDAEGLLPAEFGDSGAVSVGDRVVAIGNPMGAELSGTMTDGIISAVDRSVSLNGRRMAMLQTNAAINEGNSGGPLINLYGQVVGITNMKMANPYSSVTVEGLGFAIPSRTIQTVADQLIAHGVVAGRPGIGITVAAISPEIAEHYGLPEGGLYVYSVSEGSGAAATGVRAGDILLAVDGETVTSTDDVLRLRDLLSVGDRIRLTLWREGQTFDLFVTLSDQNEIY